MGQIEILGWTGINNKDPLHRLKTPTKEDPTADLSAAQNIDIDDTFHPELRPGFNKILSLSGTHSGYSGAGHFLYVRNGVLYRFYPDSLSSSPLLSVGNDSEMKYWTAARRVFFTNGVVIGEVKNGSANLFPNTSVPFKVRMPAGQAIAYFGARLWVLVDKNIHFNDVESLYYTDPESGFKPLPDKGRVIAPTTDGFYVGTEKGVHYFSGFNPQKMPTVKVSDASIKDVPVRYITAEKIKGLNIEKQRFPLIATDEGVCLGLPQGQLFNLTQEKYVMPPGTSGTAILRENGLGQTHYIAAYR